MTIRRGIFWLHLTAGSVAGIVILIMSVTGILLAFEKQILVRAEREYRAVAPVAGAARLPMKEILAKVQSAQSASPTNVTWHPDSSASFEIAFGREHLIFVNPYTGLAIGEGAKSLRKFFKSVEDWHRWLGAGLEKRKITRAVTGACNLAFLFLVCSGLCLWWPKSWTRFLPNAVLFRSGLQGKAREFNWHTVIGFWCCIPLFVIVLCGLVMSYPWASNLVYRAAGDTPPPSASQQAGAAPSQRDASRPSAASPVALAALDDLCTRAEHRVAGWQSINLRLPASPKESTVTFMIDTGNGGQPSRRSQLTLDQKTGNEVSWEPYSSSSRGRRWRISMRFAHTGEVFGLLGQGIAALASLGAAFLVYTGISMALRRWFA
jgi:uncharacterized iron-regulated membrane protein